MARFNKRTTERDAIPGLFDDFSIEQQPEDSRRHNGTAVEHGRTDIPQPVPFEPIRSDIKADRLRFMSFGSGSSGNCAYLGDDRFGLLIDAGIDMTKVVSELTRHGIAMSSIGGIVLTHDHGDHIRYAYTIVRKYRHIRIYCTPKTLNGILRRHNVSRRIKDYHQPVFKEFPFHLGNFVITPFDVSHDGSDNSGFFISAGRHNFVVAPDMGKITERADHYIRMANYLMIESNYDADMLMKGTYPEYLKARIIADNGHMDNADTAAYLASIYTPALKNIFLCHLSHDNNTPQIALHRVSEALSTNGIKVGDGSGSLETRGADVQLLALPRFDSTGIIVLRQE